MATTRLADQRAILRNLQLRLRLVPASSDRWPSARRRARAPLRWRCKSNEETPASKVSLDSASAFIFLGAGRPRRWGSAKSWSVGFRHRRDARHRRTALRRDHRDREAGARQAARWQPCRALSASLLGVDAAAIQLIERSGLTVHRSRPAPSWTLAAERREGDRTRTRPNLMRLDNTGHPVSNRTALACTRLPEPRPCARSRRGTMTAGRTTATSRRSTGEVHSPRVDEDPPTRPSSSVLGSDRAPLIVLLILVPARVLVVDCRHGARHVRPDDRRQRMDDDACGGTRDTCCCCGPCGR